MIVILEGENKCGKTTLAKYLVDKHKFKYIKCSQPKGDPYIEYMNILKKIKGDTVIDRFCYGENVYGPIYRGKSMLDDEKVRNIEMKALSLNPLLIYCHDEVENIAKRFDEEKEEFAVKSKIRKALFLYSKVIGKSILPRIFHKMMTPDDLLLDLDSPFSKKGEKRVDAFINVMKDNEDKTKFKTVIGNAKSPEVIFVGDKRNERQKYSEVGQPFDFGPSSTFLFEKLKAAKVPLTKIAIINSDSKELKKFIFGCKPREVVALGTQAHEKLKKLKITHQTFGHPQYENRFKKNTTQFVKQLKALNV